MYNTFKINDDGDLQFDNIGRLIMLDGKEAIIQTIMHKLNTYEGQLFYNETYGLNPGFYNIRKKEDNKDEIESYLNYALSDDVRIRNVKVVNLYNDENGNYVINMSITLTDSTILSLSLSN